jgi:hypothetical protein
VLSACANGVRLIGSVSLLQNAIAVEINGVDVIPVDVPASPHAFEARAI